MLKENQQADYGIFSDGPSSQAHAVWEITAWLRRATILLASDRSGLKASLDERQFLLISTMDGTSARLLKAGTVLGLFESGENGSYSWSPDYSWVRTDSDGWKQLIAIIRHQLSYTDLVDCPTFWIDTPLSPAAQLARDPEAYEAFLRGVASSHRQHARWLSQIDVLKDRRNMVDLGGGLGTYAIAWVGSSRTRHATIIDLPAVADLLTDLLQEHRGQLKFIGADLNDSVELPATTDFVLFANVLHLIPSWPTLLARTVRTLQKDTIVGIFEADPQTPQGMLFDLQVHLRSGRLAGLLQPDTVTDKLTDLGLRNITRLTTADPKDPFQREYRLWLGEVSKPERPETL